MEFAYYNGCVLVYCSICLACDKQKQDFSVVLSEGAA